MREVNKCTPKTRQWLDWNLSNISANRWWLVFQMIKKKRMKVTTVDCESWAAWSEIKIQGQWLSLNRSSLLTEARSLENAITNKDFIIWRHNAKQWTKLSLTPYKQFYETPFRRLKWSLWQCKVRLEEDGMETDSKHCNWCSDTAEEYLHLIYILAIQYNKVLIRKRGFFVVLLMLQGML